MKPNLLFIMTDQQRYDALGANGNDIIQTPTLDALAAAGVNLQRYYSNCPVCVPSRCTLFTGRYPHSHRVRENHARLATGREMHLFRVLKTAGYSLAYIGKNHLLENEEFENFDFTDVWGHDHQESPGEKAYGEFLREHLREHRPKGLWACPVFHDLPPENSRPYVKASSAIRFLKERDRGRPFCLCVSFSDPHVPHMALSKYRDTYPPDAMKLYPDRSGELAEKAGRFAVKQGGLEAADADEAGRRHYMAVYYAMISWIDEQVGRMLTALEEEGLREDTIVVFTTDHGEFCFEHGLYKKDLVLLESLLHVPMLIAWAGRLEPCRADGTFVEQVDVMPTLLDLMGVDAPYGCQGTSILPYLRGEREEHKDAVYGEICPPLLRNPFPDYDAFAAHHAPKKPPINVPGDFTKCVRDREFRYVWYGTGEEELYDLRRDPREQYNVAGDPSYADDRARLKLQLLEWNALSEDPLDPKCIRELQHQYDGWIGSKPDSGRVSGPEWLARVNSLGAPGI
jgi:arylsulfatase A-like enzyme